MPRDEEKRYVTGFNLYYDSVLQDLIEYLLQKELLKTDGKWSFTSFCILRTLFDYADEVVRGWEYSPEQLVDLIDMHGSLKTKFENILKEIAGVQEERTERVMEESGLQPT